MVNPPAVYPCRVLVSNDAALFELLKPPPALDSRSNAFSSALASARLVVAVIDIPLITAVATMVTNLFLENITQLLGECRRRGHRMTVPACRER